MKTSIKSITLHILNLRYSIASLLLIILVAGCGSHSNSNSNGNNNKNINSTDSSNININNDTIDETIDETNDDNNNNSVEEVVNDDVMPEPSSRWSDHISPGFGKPDKEDMHVSASKDAKITFISWDTKRGGTSPWYASKCIFKTQSGKKRTLYRNDEISWISRVRTITKKDGTTYYLVFCTAKASSIDASEWLEAYRITGDTLNEVSVVDGVGSPDSCKLSVDYSIPDWFFATQGEGYNWIFDYDNVSHNLYVPQTEDGLLIDRYWVLHFNGDRFVDMGDKPHKALHPSLARYNRLIRYYTTLDYMVRIDSLDGKQLRYAAWKRSKTMADKPDVVILGGKRRQYHAAPNGYKRDDEFWFSSGGAEYIAGYNEITLIGSVAIIHRYLLVKKNGKTIFQQEIFSND